DHVVEERPRQAVEGPALALVVGPLDHQLGVVLADGDATGQDALEGALRTLDRDLGAVDGHVDAARDGDGALTYTRHDVPPITRRSRGPHRPRDAFAPRGR